MDEYLYTFGADWGEKCKLRAEQNCLSSKEDFETMWGEKKGRDANIFWLLLLSQPFGNSLTTP